MAFGDSVRHHLLFLRFQIAALIAGADNGRGEDAILHDALRHLGHGIIVPHLEGVVRKRVQLR